MKSAECSLTARSFQFNENLVKCTPEIHSEADGHFKSYFAVNKIIFDYLQKGKMRHTKVKFNTKMCKANSGD